MWFAFFQMALCASTEKCAVVGLRTININANINVYSALKTKHLVAFSGFITLLLRLLAECINIISIKTFIKLHGSAIFFVFFFVAFFHAVFVCRFRWASGRAWAQPNAIKVKHSFLCLYLANKQKTLLLKYMLLVSVVYI